MKPETKTYELIHRDTTTTLRAQLLGSTSSQKTRHNHDPDNPPVKDTTPHTPPSTNTKPCAACFWTEIKIFRIPEDTADSPAHAHPAVNPYQRQRGKYVIYQTGSSSIPGKDIYTKLIFTDSYHEVIEVLVTRHSHQPPTLTATAARALAQAAAYDEDLDHAWTNRKTP